MALDDIISILAADVSGSISILETDIGFFIRGSNSLSLKRDKPPASDIALTTPPHPTQGLLAALTMTNLFGLVGYQKFVIDPTEMTKRKDLVFEWIV